MLHKLRRHVSALLEQEGEMYWETILDSWTSQHVEEKGVIADVVDQ